MRYFNPCKNLNDVLIRLESVAWKVLDVKTISQKEEVCSELNQIKHDIREFTSIKMVKWHNLI